MSLPASPYEHFLFYDDDVQAEQALAYVTETFDAAAILSPHGFNGMAYMVCFETDGAFSEEEAEALDELLSPDEYDLNYYPWGEEEEDE